AVLNGNGDGSFKALVTFAVGTSPWSLASADFNTDGKPDLVVSNLNSNNVSILLNTNSNTAPTLTTISTLTGATEGNPYTITYAALAAAANESDAEGDPISFRIEAVSTGTLTKNGVAVVAGATLLSAGESLVWTPAANANGTLSAFSVKASDGSLLSSTATQVVVNIAPVNDAPTASSSSVTLAAINEDSLNPSGATIQNLFGSLFSDSADAQGPVTETFTASTGGWSNATLDSSTAWGSFLGGFASGSEISKSFALNGLATNFTFDFNRIDSWDNEYFRLYANDTLIINQMFSYNQNTSTLSGSTAGFSWTIVPGAFGELGGGNWCSDQKYAVTLSVPSGVSNLTLRLNSTLNQAASDESWGIDNFTQTPQGSSFSTSNTFAGVAISSYTVDASKGNWQYSTDATTWLNLASATITAAI
ncbi:MAG: VCBS repeat-containing protein, partial [Planctomycetia bacterium]|nr:VCBS repeat-containing protein [Planctomycetia bacterium]